MLQGQQKTSEASKQLDSDRQAALGEVNGYWSSLKGPARDAMVPLMQTIARSNDPQEVRAAIAQARRINAAQVAASGGKPSIDTEYSGMSASRVARDPVTGRELWRTLAGTLRPSAQQITAQAEARKAAGIAASIPELASKIDPNDQKKLAQQAKLYGASGSPIEFYALSKMVGPVDKNYAMLFSQLGQLNASLARAYFGGRISQQLYQRLSTHMPQPGDPPELIADKVQSLLGPKGVLAQEHDSIAQLYGGGLAGPSEISPASGAPARAAGAGSSMRPTKPNIPLPPFDASRIDTSGKYIQGYARDGSVWFVNPNSGKWEPLD